MALSSDKPSPFFSITTSPRPSAWFFHLFKVPLSSVLAAAVFHSLLDRDPLDEFAGHSDRHFSHVDLPSPRRTEAALITKCPTETQHTRGHSSLPFCLKERPFSSSQIFCAIRHVLPLFYARILAPPSRGNMPQKTFANGWPASSCD